MFCVSLLSLGPRCNIFVRMQRNIAALHAPDHVAVEPCVKHFVQISSVFLSLESLFKNVGCQSVDVTPPG